MKKSRKTISLILAAVSLLSVCSFAGCSDNGNSYIWRCTKNNNSYIKGNKNSISSSSGSVQLNNFYLPVAGFGVPGGANYKKSGNRFTKLFVTNGYFQNQDLAKVLNITSNSQCSEIYVKYGKNNYTYK